MRILSVLLLSASLAVANPLIFLSGKPPIVTITPESLWWKFNDGTGTTITATVGPNGSLNGGSWTTGVSGGSAGNFNGTTDDCNSASTIAWGTNKITVCAWIWLTSTSSTRIIWENTSNPNSGSNNFSCYVNAGTIEAMVMGTLNAYRTENITAPATGAWFHLAVVHDQSTATADIKIYVNGVEQSTTIATNTHAGTSNFTTATLYVGARNITSLFFSGKIDDLRVYNRELSSTEVNNVMGDPQ